MNIKLKYLVLFAMLTVLAVGTWLAADWSDQKHIKFMQDCQANHGYVIRAGECVPNTYHQGDDTNRGA